MQFTPSNFFIGWDALCSLPSAIVEKLFQLGIAAQSRSVQQGVTLPDVLKAYGKAGASVDSVTAQSVLAVTRLLCLDIYNAQISDSATLRKKLGKQLSKQRKLTESDDALIEAIGAALSEDAVAPAANPIQLAGGLANIIAISDVGIETDLVSGRQRVFVSAQVADGVGSRGATYATITSYPSTSEAFQLVRSV
eukprot:GILJ01029409.1.p1 GENE.GILJ01029409.1~~GILJ01029409.1.p1  ORF type:complete len:194 (-),score=33.10 GILJ01029409.1:14-595(-)